MDVDQLTRSLNLQKTDYAPQLLLNCSRGFMIYDFLFSLRLHFMFHNPGVVYSFSKVLELFLLIIELINYSQLVSKVYSIP